MTAKPFLSVIIPVHNTAATLMKSVRSVLDQNFDRPIEIILVENGSTDASPELCRRIAAENPTVKHVTHSPAGLSEARNRGVREASGEWIAFLDSDDYFSPDFISSLFAAQEKHQADMVYCNFVEEWDDGRTLSEFPNTGNTIVKPVTEAVTDILLDKATSASWNRIYRREFFDNHSFPEGIIFEDHSIMFQWVSDCEKVVYVDRPLYHYCHAGATITSDAFTSNASKMRQFIAANLRRLKFTNSYEQLPHRVQHTILRHNLKVIIRFYKRYVNLIKTKSIYATDYEISQAIRLRSQILTYLTPKLLTELGMKNLIRMCRLKFFWKKLNRRTV